MSQQVDRSDTPSRWQPSTFLRFERALDTSMGTAIVVTDAGRAHIKPMGNRRGPHQLACEWVGTQLADWFVLPTFDYALLRIDAEVDEIPFLHGGKAESGPAFATRTTSGHSWGGSVEELESLVNPQDVGRLVVFDTWIRNCDRHPSDSTVRKPNYDNVFLEDCVGDVVGKSKLVAMDFTECITCGGDLSERVAHLDRITDEGLYGLFPNFRPFVRQPDVEDAIDRLNAVEESTVATVVESIPPEWEVSKRVRTAIVKFLCRRANFVAGSILTAIRRVCWPDSLFDNRT